MESILSKSDEKGDDFIRKKGENTHSSDLLLRPRRLLSFAHCAREIVLTKRKKVVY